MKKLLLFTVLSFYLFFTGTAQTTYSFTGMMDSIQVPACADSIFIELHGAQGENALVGGATGGLGGFVSGYYNVTPGEWLYIFVGGQNGFNGGGQGGINGNDQFSGLPIGTYGGWGGGASDIRRGGTSLNHRIAVAGGGGGAGHNGVWPGCQVSGPGGNGGSGGSTTGGTGTDGVGNPCNCAGGGGQGATGGTQVQGGLAGNYAGSTACLRSSWTIGNNGAFGIGGTGAVTYHNGSGGSGGGGGGWYGGGAGGNGSDTTPGGGGGGGSNHTDSLTSSISQAGQRAGNGEVTLTFFGNVTTTITLNAISICQGDSVLIFGNYRSTANTYTDTVFSTCDTIFSQSLIVTPPSQTALSPVAICQGDSALIFGNYETQQATYSLVLTDINGCDSIVTQQLVLDTSLQATISANANVGTASPAGGTYQWLSCDFPGQGVLSTSQIYFAPNGFYQVVVTLNGCVDSSACTFLGAGDVPENTFGTPVSVFPNPAKDVATILLGGSYANLSYRLIALDGRILDEKYQGEADKITLNLQNIPDGMFLVHVFTSDKSAILRMVKE